MPREQTKTINQNEVIIFNQGNIFFLEDFKKAFYHQFSTVLCLGVGPQEPSPSHVSMPIGVVNVLVSFRQPYCYHG